MAINIGSSSINGIYVGDTAVKSIYLGNKFVYGTKLEPVIDESYNYFVFDTSKVDGSTTVGLHYYRGGDTTDWDGLTDWGDGTINSSEEHTYASDGIYIVKTKLGIQSYSSYCNYPNTRKMLVKCTNINKNYIKLDNMFNMCINLTHVNIKSNINASGIESMFYHCPLLISVDLSSINVSKDLLSVREMFYNCSSLESVNISGWNLENAEDNSSMSANMFKNCNSLTRDRIIMTGCNDATIAYIDREYAAK